MEEKPHATQAVRPVQAARPRACPTAPFFRKGSDQCVDANVPSPDEGVSSPVANRPIVGESMRIGEMLVRLGLLEARQAERVLDEQEKTQEPFGAIAERLFGVRPEVIESVWIDQAQDRAVPFDATRGIDADAPDRVIRRQAWQFGIVPLRIDDGHLVAATSRRLLPRAVRFATRVLGMPVQFEIATDEELAGLLAHQYPIRGMDRAMLDRSGIGRLLGHDAA